MRISISKMAVRLAAALTVAGVVGAWAQGPIKAEMGVSINVVRKEKIETVPADFDEDAFRKTVTDDVKAIPTANVPGNLGIIKVTTNSGKWDVLISTKWGGRLMLEGDPTPAGNPTCPTGSQDDPWDATRCLDNITGAYVGPPVQGYSPASVTPLKYAASNSVSSSQDVYLEIGVGIADSGKLLSQSASLDYYALGAPSLYGSYLPVKIAQTVIQGSNRNNVTTGAPLTSFTGGISLATQFKNKYMGVGTIVPVATKSWIAGKSTASLDTDLFGLSAYPSPDNEVSYFYINVGLDRVDNALAFGGNDPGTYGETIYFELAAEF